MKQINSLNDLDELYDFVEGIYSRMSDYVDTISDYKFAIEMLYLADKHSEDVDDDERINRKNYTHVRDVALDSLNRLQSKLEELYCDEASAELKGVRNAIYSLSDFASSIVDPFTTIANETDTTVTLIRKADILREAIGIDLRKALSGLDSEEENENENNS
jgi:hypothetical protein